MSRCGGQGDRGRGVRRRVVGAGGAVGVVAALGLAPFAGAPVAHADFDLDGGVWDSILDGVGAAALTDLGTGGGA